MTVQNVDFVAAVAKAFGVDKSLLTDVAVHEQPTHVLGLWSCQDDAFYGFAYRQVREEEGADWITNDRAPSWTLARWAEFEAVQAGKV